MVDTERRPPLAVLGRPGAGKTWVIEQLLARDPSLVAIDDALFQPPAGEERAFVCEAPPQHRPGVTAIREGLFPLWLTVVDASRFEEDCMEAALLSEANLAGPPGWTVADLLLEQIEGAHVIALNRCDLVAEPHLRRLMALMSALNPMARVVSTTTDGWTCAASTFRKRAEADLERPTHPDVTTFTWRARRPFHAQRLFECIMRGWHGVIRSRGVFYVDTQPDEQLAWSTAGAEFRFEHLGRWRQRPYQELFFIGLQLDQPAIEAELREAMRTESANLPAPPRHLADPFSRPAARP